MQTLQILMKLKLKHLVLENEHVVYEELHKIAGGNTKVQHKNSISLGY